jgi:hypothetical protein
MRSRRRLRIRATADPSIAAANNRCFKAALTWQHGTYTFNANNSLSLRPFAPDGYVQVMDPCAGTSVNKYNYNQCVPRAAQRVVRVLTRRARFELIPAWYNYLDAHPGFMPHGQTAYALRLFNDGGNGTAGAPKVSLRTSPPHAAQAEVMPSHRACSGCRTGRRTCCLRSSSTRKCSTPERVPSPRSSASALASSRCPLNASSNVIVLRLTSLATAAPTSCAAHPSHHQASTISTSPASSSQPIRRAGARRRSRLPHHTVPHRQPRPHHSPRLALLTLLSPYTLPLLPLPPSSAALTVGGPHTCNAVPSTRRSQDARELHNV